MSRDQSNSDAEPNRLFWFAIWTGDGMGSFVAYRKRREALAARTPGTNRPADVIVKTTKAELDRLGDFARTFR